ncbi:hypothetical protein [Sutcliffiella sp. FSL R7-0096]|uniref:hypothetical protein n=1 Tax=Sutcliffiella sp. FSL R7-0096 TaxID=2921670 RepID=UPI00315B12A0
MKIDVHSIASEIMKENREAEIAMMEQLYDEFNGQLIELDNLPGKLIEMSTKISSKQRKAQSIFTIELIQRVVDELSKQED